VSEADALVLPRRNEDPDFENGSIFFIGTATVLIRYAGFTILTDPNFLHRGDHVHLGYGLISRRQTNPAVEMEDLPPLDFVLLSHLHGDHFDRVAERKLNIEPRTAIPIHYNDYTVFKSPLEDVKRAVAEAGLADRVHYLSHGDTYEFEVPATS
jgi:L-ascorbate metabolism protein UlaG (beta-lactamase superfamily)